MSFDRDSKGHARTKAITRAGAKKSLAEVAGRLPVYLIFGGVLIASSGFVGLAQQPAKTVHKPAPGNAPSKISSTTQASAPANSPSISSNDPQQLLIAGQAAQDQRRFDEAIRTYNRVIALSANHSRTTAIANLRIGNVYMSQGKFGNAEVAFEHAVMLNPNDAESYNNLGEARGELKEYPRAIEAFNKAVSLDPKFQIQPGGQLRSHG